jgi:hypothetical protein
MKVPPLGCAPALSSGGVATAAMIVRVRGSNPRGCPSPQPLSAKSGERERTEFVAMTMTRTHDSLTPQNILP